EIVVTVADGFLYGLRQQLLAAPAPVADLDGLDGQGGQGGDVDVDQLTTVDSLYAAWTPVGSATAYEVAVVTPSGSYVTQPEWQNVGDVTRTARGGLPLVDGHRYLFAVRALSHKGASTEAL